jgi:hypothetical protein
MSFRKSVGLLILSALGGAAVYGCSSSSTDNGGAVDAGGTADTGPGKNDGSTPGTDSGGTSDSSSGDDGGTALVCPPASTAGFQPPAYVPATANQGKCTTPEVAAFVTACGDNGTMSSCNAWQTSNLASDAGPGTTCGNCIIAPQNNGGTWVDTQGYFGPNYAACIQLTDATHGAACAAADESLGNCQGVACDSCTGTASDAQKCIAAANAGGCAQYVGAVQSACVTDFADGGAAATCSPGAASGKQDPDFTYIVTLICGGAPADGGGD